MKDVVVAVQGVSKGKPFPPIVADIVTRGRAFFPFVGIVQNHDTFTVKNEDPILHNAQLYQSEKGNLLLTVPNPPDSFGTFPIRFEHNRRIYQMICGMHEFMQARGYAVDNPYYALTDERGVFRIDALPPGTYKVTAWRPHFHPIERTVTIAPNGTASLVFEFDADTVSVRIMKRRKGSGFSSSVSRFAVQADAPDVPRPDLIETPVAMEVQLRIC